MRTIILAAALLAGTHPSIAADTIVGPTQVLCSEATGGTSEKAAAIAMWVVGYVSGVNNLSKTDFLKDRDTEAIFARFWEICRDRPDKTVLTASRDLVARLRMETLQRLQEKENSN